MSDQMTMLEFSSSIADAEAVPPIPARDYTATISNVEIKESQTTGNRYLSTTFDIAADAIPADYPAEFLPDSGVVRITYNRVSLEDTPAARHRLKKFLGNLGAPLPSKVFDIEPLLGLMAKVTVAHSEYEGEKRAEIKAIQPA